MDGFKNSTRVQYMKGGSCEGYAKGGKVKGAAKIAKVMGEFKAGTLHSGSKKGPEVTNPKQAVAIAMSEARKAGMKAPVKKNHGGSMSESTSARPVKVGMTDAEKAAAGAVARGNRMQELEGREEAKLMREKRPAPKPVPRQVAAAPKTSEAETPQSALSVRLQRRPSAQDMARAQAAKGKGSFRSIPLVGAAMDALGLKKGGLAAMPRKK